MTRSKPTKTLMVLVQTGKDQDELQHGDKTLICREESNGGRTDGEYKRI